MQRSGSYSLWALAAALLLPLISMAIVPCYDTSEPRYAEITRIMAETGDWVTPWFDPGVPFWGKPPLSFWAQALSIKTFGLTEFAVRFPSWLCLLSSTWILFSGLRNTERSLVYFVDQQPGPRLTLFCLDKPPFSAKFYSVGRAKKNLIDDVT